MSDADLTSLTERFGLAPQASDQLALYAAMLGDDPLAPTTVTDPARVRDDHFADSLVALELEVIRGARTLADIGAGAGLPGLALAIALPDCQVTMLEAVNKKCAFMRGAVARMGLANVTVVHARAEEYRDGFDAFDVVTARALARLDVVAEYAAPLLTVGGTLVAWRGKSEPEVESQATQAAEILGLSVDAVVQVWPYPTAEHRYLHLMSKVTPTPERFPRRAGMARKRPLGS